MASGVDSDCRGSGSTWMEYILQEGFDRCTPTQHCFRGQSSFCFTMFCLIFSKWSTSCNKYFDVLYEPETTVDPLDDWISSAIIITMVDVITWWTGMEATGHPLARMALDFVFYSWYAHSYYLICHVCSQISVPSATSTDIEHRFSRGGLTVSKMCHSLSDKSTRPATVIWLMDRPSRHHSPGNNYPGVQGFLLYDCRRKSGQISSTDRWRPWFVELLLTS